ncbi:NAD-dependent epimerase/dehydratase family protein [Dethiosulfatarculus sandiegensis]|uniref:Nucleotide sugar epimerase n=1 Tax=Dethiosulfatarculus sandiegensis TaxID=1429043 RepID=A0A0D2J3Z4_9BACT|nr:NAD-dependent epimerase/dehydratase family protein [Dethiosulfatarculus sandiegensis]KIX12889.1 nucleotide sugar epimerase [Dethiosulfatarculus sandiegensis]
MKVLVTGVAGFIGSQVSEKLLDLGHRVCGVDCFTDYYPRELKDGNLRTSLEHEAFEFLEQDIVTSDLDRLLDQVDVVIHLAAQAGVRKSWGSNFQVYTHNNVMSTQALLEKGMETGLKRLVYASSSSVYGDSKELPSHESNACWPVSPYGVTKLAGEHLAGLYHRNFGLDTVSLRYFTVYGPRQRPDMAFHRFIRAMIEGAEIRLFGDGEQSRDFTFVSDVVDATVAAALAPEAKGRVFNIGGGARVSVNRVIELLEGIIGKKAKVNRLPVAKGDVRNTSADTSSAREILGYTPAFDLQKGLELEYAWVSEMLPILQKVVG